MISGAGAVADGADRSVRLLTSRSTGGPFAARPGSVIVAIVLLALDPAVVAGADDLGDRTYSSMHGSLLTDWVETFEDTNDNGIEDPDERGIAWFYWLVDPGVRRGVTVRSTRAPADLFQFEGAGVVIADPGYGDDSDPWFDDEVAAAGLHLDPAVIVDATHATGSAVPVDLAADLPPSGTAVRPTVPSSI